MGKRLLLYFVVGLLIFFLMRGFFEHIFPRYNLREKQVVGMVGTYTVNSLPPDIMYKISKGLTAINEDGTAKPGVAKSWKIESEGRKYTFYLKEDVYFSDKKNLTSDLIDYGFSNVDIERPDKYTVVFKLKDAYSPFLTTVSRPIFRKGFVGVSEYRVKNISLNGDFVESIELISLDKKKTIRYQFYPTVSSAKTAFVLGDVSKIVDLPDVNFKNSSFYKFNNAIVEKRINYRQLVTLFYNTQDENLSSKSLREAFSYTISDSFKNGEKSFGPYAPFSFASQKGISLYRQDLDHAKLLLEKFRTESPNAKLSFVIDTLAKYRAVAEDIAKVWNGLKVETKIREVDETPAKFQIFLGEFFLSLDPDQYVLWHSDQQNNITGYKNLRIDKLLEDGRQISDIEERKKIYFDFQKYLLADAPASFLFFPYTYDVSRK